jgi:hypothetical protein
MGVELAGCAPRFLGACPLGADYLGPWRLAVNPPTLEVSWLQVRSTSLACHGLVRWGLTGSRAVVARW